MRTLRHWIAVLLIVVVAIAVASPRPAHACSCMGLLGPADALGESQIAFTGTVIRSNEDQAGMVENVVSVSEVIKGEVPEQVSIWTASDSAACGMTVSSDVELGFSPSFDSTGRRWTVGLCGGLYSSANLRGAVRELPVPIGAGPIALLVGGQWKDASLTAYDLRGSPVGYAFTPGLSPAHSIDVCPEAASAVSLHYSQLDGSPVFVSTDLTTMEVSRVFDAHTHPIAGVDWSWLGRIACVDADGSRLVLPMGGAAEGSATRGDLVVIDLDEVTKFPTPGIAGVSPFSDDEVLWLEGDAPGGAVMAMNTTTGVTREFARLGNDQTGFALQFDPASGVWTVTALAEAGVLRALSYSADGSLVNDAEIPIVPAVGCTGCVPATVDRLGAILIVNLATSQSVTRYDLDGAPLSPPLFVPQALAVGDSTTLSVTGENALELVDGDTVRRLDGPTIPQSMVRVVDGPTVDPASIELRADTGVLSGVNPIPSLDAEVAGGSGGSAVGALDSEQAGDPAPEAASPDGAEPQAGRVEAADDRGVAPVWLIIGGVVVFVGASSVVRRARRRS